MRVESDRTETRFDKIQQAEPTKIVANLNGSLYSVLFNANKGVHSLDLKFVYDSLINANISKDNISVLEGDGKTQNKFVNKSATIKNLDSVIDSIRKKANSNDRLLVYVTGHGKLINELCYLKSYDGEICEKDFEKVFQELPVNYTLFYFSQCYSGGFAERMGYKKNIGMSNAEKKGYSCGNSCKDVGAFFTHFLFPNILIPGKSIEKAFDEAVFEDTSITRMKKIERINSKIYPDGSYSEVPQLRWQNADPSLLCLGK